MPFRGITHILKKMGLLETINKSFVPDVNRYPY